MLIKATDISGSQAPFILHVLPCLVVPPINLTGGRFTTGTGLSSFILSSLNRTTGRWSAFFFTTAECAAKYTYVDALSTPLSLHYFVALL